MGGGGRGGEGRSWSGMWPQVDSRSEASMWERRDDQSGPRQHLQCVDWGGRTHMHTETFPAPFKTQTELWEAFRIQQGRSSKENWSKAPC